MKNDDINTGLFFKELSSWLAQKGFFNDRGWKEKDRGMGFYSFGRGKFRVEIRTGWNLNYSSYGPIFVQFIDCEKEVYSSGGYIGWMGQHVLQTFKEPFTRSLFDEICKHHGI